MNFRQIIQYLSDFSGVPITCFVQNAETFYTVSLPYLPRLTQNIPPEPVFPQNKASCLLTDELLCYGRLEVETNGAVLLFGPISANNQYDNRRAQRILRSLNLSTTESGELISYLRSTPVFSYQKFCNFILFANDILNQKELQISELLGDNYIIRRDEILDAAEEPLVTADADTVHDAQRYEQTLFSMLQMGQYQKMKDFLNESTYQGNEGTLAADLHRHHKNLLIASVTLASRCAVSGGLDYETAMTLADAFIQKIELAPDMYSLLLLQNNMLLTYTRMVQDIKRNNADGSISARTQRFIGEHIGEKLSGQMIAGALGVSRTYLSSQFKRETGINLNTFINQAKVNEAKLLLRTTDLSITDIAGHLAFSSQSHLHSVFKKTAGMTPAEYRAK